MAEILVRFTERIAAEDGTSRRPRVATPHAILDPFVTYAEGEKLLRSQLAALSHDHLVNIIKAYELPVDAHESMSDAGLIDGIVAAVAPDAR